MLQSSSHLDNYSAFRNKNRNFSSRDILPSTIDLRYDTFPVRNQKSIGCCASISICATIQFLLRTKYNQKCNTLSPSFVYYNIRQLLRPKPHTDSGATIEEAIEAVQKYGVCKEKYWPWTQRQLIEEPNLIAYRKANQFIQISKYTHLFHNLNTLRSILSKGYVINAGIHIYESFHSEKTLRTGIISYPNQYFEKYKGAHAILLVGYQDKMSRFIFQNSWGAGVGENGFFYIPYDYILNANLCCELILISQLEFM